MYTEGIHTVYIHTVYIHTVYIHTAYIHTVYIHTVSIIEHVSTWCEGMLYVHVHYQEPIKVKESVASGAHDTKPNFHNYDGKVVKWL